MVGSLDATSVQALAPVDFGVGKRIFAGKSERDAVLHVGAQRGGFSFQVYLYGITYMLHFFSLKVNRQINQVSSDMPEGDFASFVLGPCDRLPFQVVEYGKVDMGRSVAKPFLVDRER